MILSVQPENTFPDSSVVEWKYINKYGSFRCVTAEIGSELECGLDYPIIKLSFSRNYLMGHGDLPYIRQLEVTGRKNDGLGKLLRTDPRKCRRYPYRTLSSNPYTGNYKFCNYIFAIGF